jgi:hypothetical protein
MSLIIGLAHLLISKGVISREEVARILQHLSDHSGGENEAMMKMILDSATIHFEDKPSSGSKN